MAAILRRAGLLIVDDDHKRREMFEAREFHGEVVLHSRQLFLQGNFFHAVFEAAKAYNKKVREKARSEKDGHALMLEVWGCENGVLKVTPCNTEKIGRA